MDKCFNILYPWTIDLKKLTIFARRKDGKKNNVSELLGKISI